MAAPTEESVLPDESDESLMRRFASGSEDAFERLFDRYSPRVVGFAARFLGRRAGAEDAAPGGFLRVFRHRERYDPGRPFKPWLFSIASRLVSNRLRDRKRRPQEPLESGGPGLLDDGASIPEDDLERERLAQTVRKAVDALPENQRAAILMARFEGMSYEEISAAMDLSVSSVKSLLFRAKRRLSRALAHLARDSR